MLARARLHLLTLPLHVLVLFQALISPLSAMPPNAHPRAGNYGDGMEDLYRPHYGYRYGHNKNKDKHPDSESPHPGYWQPAPTSTTPTPIPTPSSTVAVSQCNTGSFQCCQSVREMNRSEIVGLSSDLDGVDEFFQVGLRCSPLSVIGSGSTSCTQQPVCCTGNNFNGLIVLGCVPIFEYDGIA